MDRTENGSTNPLIDLLPVHSTSPSKHIGLDMLKSLVEVPSEWIFLKTRIVNLLVFRG